MDAPGLQPIPEDSGAGNRLTEGSNVSKPEIQARMDDRADIRRLGLQLEEMRCRLLPDALRRCIGVITATKANKWFRFMQTYLPRCLNGEEIEG